MVSGLLIVAGLLLLFFGADSLVRGSSALALKAGLSSLVVGLTVVAFGTSAPELVVSANSALQGQGDLALGNVIGSNIFNVAVILGVTALIIPLNVHKQILKFDVPVMIGSMILIFLFLKDQSISRLEGLFLISLITIYIMVSVYFAKKGKMEITVEQQISRHVSIDIIRVIGGIVLLVIGSIFLVKGALTLARLWGVSEAVIGLTVIAFGTSLPELATTIVAGIKKEVDIAIGNIIGSNIFNVLAILGISATIRPINIIGFQMKDMIFTFVPILILFVFITTGKRIDRWEGAILVGLYGGYLVMIWPR